jgi:hypothetical protein
LTLVVHSCAAGECGDCYGAGSEGDCCNSCDDVRDGGGGRSWHPHDVTIGALDAAPPAACGQRRAVGHTGGLFLYAAASHAPRRGTCLINYVSPEPQPYLSQRNTQRMRHEWFNQPRTHPLPARSAAPQIRAAYRAKGWEFATRAFPLCVAAASLHAASRPNTSWHVASSHTTPFHVVPRRDERVTTLRRRHILPYHAMLRCVRHRRSVVAGGILPRVVLTLTQLLCLR